MRPFTPSRTGKTVNAKASATTTAPTKTPPRKPNVCWHKQGRKSPRSFWTFIPQSSGRIRMNVWKSGRRTSRYEVEPGLGRTLNIQRPPLNVEPGQLSMNRPFVLVLVLELVLDRPTWFRGRGRGRERERLGSWSQCALLESEKVSMDRLFVLGLVLELVLDWSPRCRARGRGGERARLG